MSLPDRLVDRMRAPRIEAGGRTQEQIETDLRSRLLRPVTDSTAVSWAITLLITAFAALLRLVNLDRPARLVFDETYYVKQAYSLLTLGYEGVWAEDPNLDFAAGDFSDLGTDPDYVVHPSVGKWMIALGLKALGPTDPVGWRISGAIVGTLSVLILIRVARRLFGSTVLGAVAGLLLAVDGIHLVLSRIAILDVFLSFWALCAFAAVLMDRERHRRRLAARAAAQLAARGAYEDPWGPKVGIRWWLVAAGVFLGLACGVKWSGAYFVAVFGVLVVAWSITARRAIGVRYWVGGGALRDGVGAFIKIVPVALGVYVLSWVPWLRSDRSYMRHWAEDVNAVAAEPQRTWMPDWLNSLWEYHLHMWHFHNGLESEHTYMSNPLGWLVQQRPTSFAWRDLTQQNGAEIVCGSSRCASAILALGNPLIWWGAVVALAVVVFYAFARRDWRAWAVLAGYAAGYLPWLGYMHRTIFTFYTVAFVPYVVLALTFAIGLLMGSDRMPRRERRPGIWVAASIVLLALAVSAFYWPVWTSAWVPYWYWNLHMLLPTWI